MDALKLIESPRLFVTADIAEHLKDRLHSPYLKSLAQVVLRDADHLVRTAPLPEGREATWQHGTRAIDTRLGCLTSAWVLTRDPRYRKAALKHLAGLTAWNQISCEANKAIPADVQMGFCLSYGELSHTVGLMYDLFRPEMTDEEQRVFYAMFDKFLLRAALACVERPMWWAFKPWSNWNGVCCGGMGVMALALYEDRPEARKLIPFVETSLDPYFKSYIENGGGCPEGTGYWNYAMNYAMRYVLSWERATGKKHPALKIKPLGQSLQFPLDFTGITFGDNDGWGPTAFFFLLARRLKMPHAALNAAAYLPEKADVSTARKGPRVANGDLLFAADAIPTVEEMKALKTAHTQERVPVARVYKGMGWAALADDEAFPSLRMAVRGGSSVIAGHGMIDLLSFRCRVNGELMITDQQDGGYMGSTFSKRGHEIYGRSIASKSSLFVDGLGCNVNVSCDKTEVVRKDDLLGIRIDASHAYLVQWKELFIGRLVLMVENAYWLVIDHVKAPREVATHWAESRFHTHADSQVTASGVSLVSGKQKLQMSFAALGQKGVLQASTGMPSQSTVSRTTIFRWMSAQATHDNFHVVALHPGSRKLKIKLSTEKGGVYVIEVTKPDGQTRQIRLNAKLKLS